jgi:AAA+ superfamily predicted ATPase
MQPANECSIMIPTHKKSYFVSGYASKEIVKIKYSNRFKALHYFLSHNCKAQFPKLCEVMEITDACREYSHAESEDYILLPYQNTKTLICPEKNIHLELTVCVDNSADNEDKKTKNNQTYKQYSCILSTPGNDPIALHNFLDECIKTYNEKMNINDNSQRIFEYVKTEYDSNDRKVATYNETPFISNKHLTKNIFFPEKAKFIEHLDKFVHNREKHQAEYEELGQTYKMTTLLHGIPGTGKTCIIRGMLNYTKRDAVLVPWSNLKTCSDLASILRCNVYNGKKRGLKDLIFIFEDFDANHSKVLKTRKPATKNVYKSSTNTETDSETDITVIANKLHNSANDVNVPSEILEQIKTLKEYAMTMTVPNTKPMEDELTLEYVLNMFDGIVEQHDAIIVFTTNHLEEIDPAVIRPGRVDYILELKEATKETITEMLAHRYKKSMDEMKEYEKQIAALEKMTPAEVQKRSIEKRTIESFFS